VSAKIYTQPVVYLTRQLRKLSGLNDDFLIVCLACSCAAAALVSSVRQSSSIGHPKKEKWLDGIR
jgi:hypothetical protein